MKSKALLLFALLSAAAAAPNPIVGEIKLAAPSGVPVPWSRDGGRYTLYLGCGCFDFTNEKGESRATDKVYLYAWRWHYQWGEFHFSVEEAIAGTLPEIVFLDLNGDGIEEIILKNVAGAHTHVWRIYQRDGRWHDLKKIGEVCSDEGKIIISDKKVGGYAVIESWDRNYSDREHPTRRSSSFKVSRYQQE